MSEEMNVPPAPCARVEMYTWRVCPYCTQAKRLLEAKGVSYEEYLVDVDAAAREAMKRRAPGWRTVPLIFINGNAVGGYAELEQLRRSGELDALLRQAPSLAPGDE